MRSRSFDDVETEFDEINEDLHNPSGFVFNIVNQYNDIIEDTPTVNDDDLFQEGWLGLLESAESWDKDHGTSFPVYAYIYVRNQILTLIREETDKEKGKVSYDKEEWIKETEMGEEDGDIEQNVKMEEYIEGLSVRKRKIVNMYIKGYTQEEIGQELGVTQQAISKALNNL